MFSGIIEAKSSILMTQDLDRALRIRVQRPLTFDDIKLGDSVAVNGVCLTIEECTPELLTFTLAAETLKVLRWNQAPWTHHPINLERSLRFGDRIHGHLVSGHVDELGEVVKAESFGDSWLLDVSFDSGKSDLIWKKGSITIQGVSLTVNEVKGSILSVCLIPETVKRTNLSEFKVHDFVNLEYDWMAKALIHSFQKQIKEMRTP
ncbi:MAG: riboflavin synthase [Bdellovibrionaceae bacterium]|nr:riboflavin synthase [Pseudobdellovibrionaceae bacterium]